MAKFIVIHDTNEKTLIINTDQIMTIEKQNDKYGVHFTGSRLIFVDHQNAELIFSVIGQRI